MTVNPSLNKALFFIVLPSIRPLMTVNPSLNSRCKPRPARPTADGKAFKSLLFFKKQQKARAKKNRAAPLKKKPDGEPSGFYISPHHLSNTPTGRIIAFGKNVLHKAWGAFNDPQQRQRRPRGFAAFLLPFLDGTLRNTQKPGRSGNVFLLPDVSTPNPGMNPFQYT